jgi:small subunit ribosomal protein S6
MNFYENIVIINPSLSDAEIESAAEKIKDQITSSGGELLRADAWGRKKLMYEVRKQKKGFYLFLIFKSPSLTIKKLEDYYKVFDPIIKQLVIRITQKQAEAALQKAPTTTENTQPVAEKTEQKSE